MGPPEELPADAGLAETYTEVDAGFAVTDALGVSAVGPILGDETADARAAEAVWAAQSDMIAAQARARGLPATTGEDGEDRAERGPVDPEQKTSGLWGLVAAARQDAARTAKESRPSTTCPSCGSTKTRVLPTPLDGGFQEMQCREKGCRTRWALRSMRGPVAPAAPAIPQHGQIPAGGGYQTRSTAGDGRTAQDVLNTPPHRRFPDPH